MTDDGRAGADDRRAGTDDGRAGADDRRAETDDRRAGTDDRRAETDDRRAGADWRSARLAVVCGLLVTAAVGVVLLAGPAPATARPAYELPYERVDGDAALSSPTAAGWSSVPTATVPLSSAPSGLPNADATSTERVRVQAAHDEERLFLRLRWTDATPDRATDDPRAFADAVAVQLPVDRSARPPIAMGSADNRVNVWYWRADGETQALLAGGAGTTTQFDRPAVDVSARHHNDTWTVVYERSLQTAGTNRTAITDEADTDLALAVWNGSTGERAGRKAVSSWYYLPTADDGGSPFAALLWSVAGLAVLVVVVVTADAVRRNREGES